MGCSKSHHFPLGLFAALALLKVSDYINPNNNSS